jgi:putative ABC transport system ATP-binding protein
MTAESQARRAFTDEGPDAEALLVLDTVQAGYPPAAPLFTDLSLRVGPGEIVALRGRSGSGKSTALHVAMGLRPPTEGRVLWQDADLYSLDDNGRAQIRRDQFGIVLQDGGLLYGLTALENVLTPVLRRRARPEDLGRAEAALDSVGLADRASHTPARLSGGECQRVALARALFTQPAILVVDEPTASLDRASADTVIDLLVKAADNGRAVLVASHDPAVIDAANRYHDIEPPYVPRRHRAP